MANNKSAKKRIRITAKRTLENKSVKTRTKTAVKKFLTSVEGGDKSASAVVLSNTASVLDRAVTKGVLHKNTAARKKSRLAARLNKMA